MKGLSFGLVALGCATVAALSGRAPARALPSGCEAGIARYDVAVPGHPFAVASSPDGRFVFLSIVSSSPTSANGIGVLSCENDRYRLKRFIRLESQPLGLAMTHDRKLLIVADDGFTVFVSTRAALAGEPAIVGYLQDLPGDVEDNDPGEVNVNVSPDDRFAFVSDEQNLTITVIDLSKARGNRFSRDAIVGQIPVANAPIALTFSRDGRYLFTTSEIARRAYGWPKICRPEGAPQTDPPTNPAGAIITIDVQKAESDPEHSIVSEEPADCSPVRMSMSPDGATLWVSNRASNTVTEFTTEALIARSEHARIATIAVGSNPVPILASRDGRYVLVGETNRFGPGGTGAGVIAVIDATSKKVVGSIPVGTFPREFSYGVGATIFLANYRSNSLTIFDAARIADLVTRALPSLQTKGN